MSDKQIDEQWIERIIKSLEGIEYGSVQIVIHDSKITQIDRLEKQRFSGKKNDKVKQQINNTIPYETLTKQANQTY